MTNKPSAWPIARRAMTSFFLLVAALGQPTAQGAETTKPERPRLAIVLVFDQLRGDYLSRWRDLFIHGDSKAQQAGAGFRRLQSEGAWFCNCHYPYGNTLTAPGHASISTGCAPSEHGIIGNAWYDRAAGETRIAIESGNYRRVPSIGAAATVPRDEITRTSPELLLAPTLADALLKATENRARIVTVSLKDRGAVFMAARQKRESNHAYWFDSHSGTFITSSYYRAALPDWVSRFNTSFEGRSPADKWLGKFWDRCRSDVDYAARSGPDEARGEGIGHYQGRTFPHPMSNTPKPGKEYYDAVQTSPFGNELLLDFTKRAIVEEKLGTRDVPDLLCVSFASNDLVGHSWGPDSQEVLDVTLRADLLLAKLLTFLDDDRALKGKYILGVSADHGVSPLPEAALEGNGRYVSSATGGDHGVAALPQVAAPRGGAPERISPATIKLWAQQILTQAYSENLLLDSADIWLYLDRPRMAQRGLDPAKVEQTLARGLEKQPDILTAYTRTQLTASLGPHDAMGELIRRSYHAERSGDVAIVLRPCHPLSEYLTGTSHGSPYPYDTHVPLLVFGPGIVSGVHEEPVVPQALPAILARALGIEPPGAAKTPVPGGLFAAP